MKFNKRFIGNILFFPLLVKSIAISIFGPFSIAVATGPAVRAPPRQADRPRSSPRRRATGAAGSSSTSRSRPSCRGVGIVLPLLPAARSVTAKSHTATTRTCEQIRLRCTRMLGGACGCSTSSTASTSKGPPRAAREVRAGASLYKFVEALNPLGPLCMFIWVEISSTVVYKIWLQQPDRHLQV